MFQLLKRTHTNPALDRISVVHSSENFNIEIYPNLGASLQRFVKNNIQIIDGISNDDEGLETYKQRYNSSWLFPFPNRIENGKYLFEGKEYQLKTNETALHNALHGFVYNKNFDLIQEEVSENFTELKFHYSYGGAIQGYPFPFDFQVSYTIKLNTIEINIKALNTGSSNMPFGIGWHPYFKSDALSKSILNFDGTSQYEVNDHMIPVKETTLKNDLPLELKDISLDDCFMSRTTKTNFNAGNYHLKIEFEPTHTRNFIQCYTPPARDCIAIEPMTCAPNAFNNEYGLLILKPNEQYLWNIKMTL